MKLKEVAKLAAKPLVLINRIVPKNRRLVLFYSNLGFRDNVRAMYDYLVNEGLNKRLKIVCAVDDYRRFAGTAPENVRFVSCKRGLLTFFRCGTMFYSFGKYPIKPARGQEVVNLWHGMPLKSIGNLEPGCENNDYYYYTRTIATSPFFGDIMRRCFRCPKRAVMLVGQPRCDVLMRPDRPDPERLILWLPTYRSSQRLGSRNAELDTETSLPACGSSEELKRLDELLSSLGWRLVIKPHPMQDPIPCESLESIEILGQEADINELMLRSAALITDYSSVYFDYLLLNRPIGFTAADIGRYGEERGFTVSDPAALMPGAKLGGFEALCRFVTDTAAGIDGHAYDRRRINELVNSHQDGHAAERIAHKFLF